MVQDKLQPHNEQARLIPYGEGGRWFDTSVNCIAPWYTTPCLEWLLTLKLKGKKIFEYGTGDSTTWYKMQFADVYGVEFSKEWADKTGTYRPETKDGYLQHINSNGPYDIVIIDGDFRDECTYYALKNLKKDGFLVFDNWKQPTVQPHWPLTEKLIEGMNIKLHFEPGHWDKWCSAVVTNKG